MPKMLIDVDEQALEAAQDALGTDTKKDTVNTALREVAAQVRRAAAWSDFKVKAADGLDLDILRDKNRYRPKPG